MNRCAHPRRAIPASGASGLPFLSDSDLRAAASKAGLPEQEVNAVIDANAEARIDGLRAALAVLAVFAVLGLFFTGRIPREPVGSAPSTQPAGSG